MASELSGMTIDSLCGAIAADGFNCGWVATELKRRLSSRPEVPAVVMAAAESTCHIWRGIDDFDSTDLRLMVLMARFILSLSPATPEVK